MNLSSRWVRPAIAFLLVAVAYFYRIDRPLLWNDEADTGVEARTILHSGIPSAYDGRNLNIYDSGTQLNQRLLCQKIGWTQYYLGAASLWIFGNSTGGLRILFAALGLLAFVPIYAVLKRGKRRCPEIIAALALLAPQTLLFQRSARYYPILILLFAALVWDLTEANRSRRHRLATGATIFVLLFQTHSFAALCIGLALLCHSALFGRRHFPDHLITVVTGFLSWAVWYLALGPALNQTPLFLSLLPPHPGVWAGQFIRGIGVTVLDLDAVGSLPLLLLAGALALLAGRNRPALKILLAEPCVGFVLLCLLIQAVAAAGLFGLETSAGFGILRYLPHLAVFGLVAIMVMLDQAIPSGPVVIALGACAVATNFFSVSYWTNPLRRELRASWIAPVYSDILKPPPTTWDAVFTGFQAEAAARAGNDSVLIAYPPFVQALLIFYAGDRYRIPPVAVTPSSAGAAEPYVRRVIGAPAFARLHLPPDWLLDALGVLPETPPGFALVATIPSYQGRPFDGTRPELTRHTFAGPAPVAQMSIYRRVSP